MYLPDVRSAPLREPNVDIATPTGISHAAESNTLSAHVYQRHAC